MDNNNDRAPHILNTSANLLGLCFIVLTSLKVLKLGDSTVIDEITTGAIFFFMISSILSFLSIKSISKSSELYETIADILFLTGLVCLFVTTMLITFNVIN